MILWVEYHALTPDEETYIVTLEHHGRVMRRQLERIFYNIIYLSVLFIFSFDLGPGARSGPWGHVPMCPCIDGWDRLVDGWMGPLGAAHRLGAIQRRRVIGHPGVTGAVRRLKGCPPACF